jgi:hypothetical protein
MSKTGEGHQTPNYHKEMERQCVHFLQAMIKHFDAKAEERGHWEGVLDETAKLILAAASEIPRFGMHKEAALLEKSLKKYLESPTTDTLDALEHIVVTLREYNC